MRELALHRPLRNDCHVDHVGDRSLRLTLYRVAKRRIAWKQRKHKTEDDQSERERCKERRSAAGVTH